MLTELRRNFDLVVVVVLALVIYHLVRKWAGHRKGIAA